MIYKTLPGVLHPDGTVTLPSNGRPDHAVRVLVTLLEDGEDASLAEPGDYLTQLMDYEDRLARGEIQCKKQFFRPAFFKFRARDRR